MGTHPIFESDFDCLTDRGPVMFDKDGNPLSKNEQKRLMKEMKKQKEQAEKVAKKAASQPANKEKKVEDSEDNLTPNQYTEIRKKKLEEMRQNGQNPYPHKFHVSGM